MDEHRFVAAPLDGEPMSKVCRQFILRKAGYKIHLYSP
jgi:hypothetical protein